MNQKRRGEGHQRDAAVWWTLSGALLVAGLALEWSRRYGYNVCDDSLISLQYARNVSEGLGFVFNAGERVEGFTNFLWVAFLALVHPLSDGTSAGFVRLATLTSIALAAVDIFFLYRLGRLIWPRMLAPIAFAVGLCALDNGYTVWAMQALESHLLIFTMLGGCLLLWREPSRWSGVGAALCLAAAMMTRPDAALFVAVLGASELLWALRSSDPKRALLRAIAVFGMIALVFGVYFLWRYDYFGYLFPNTYYVKASGLSNEAIARGFRYLDEFLSDRAYVPLLALGAVVGIRDRKIGPLFAWTILYAGYVVYVGGDFYPGHRFFVVLIPFVALLSAYTLERAACWTRARWRARPRAAWGIWAFGFSLVAIVGVRGLQVGPVQTEVIRWRGEVARVRALMEWLGERAPPGASIVTGDIGSSGFYANLHVYDYFGIIDPVTAHQDPRRLGRGKAGHEKHADPDYLLGKKPTYIKRGYIHRDLYQYGYYLDSDIPPHLNEPGIWRKDELGVGDGLALQSRIPFEAQPYAGWSASGEAFQQWPVQRPPRGQHRVVGRVDWFVSTYHPTRGDAVVGRLESAPIPLEGDLFVIRVAGGRDPERLRAELVVDGEVIASATGHNSEIFARHVWNIAEYPGRLATLRIVDEATGRWGHIMVDEIEQWATSSDAP
jgi:hypothetical protein